MLTVVEHTTSTKILQFSPVSCKAAFNSRCSTGRPLGQIKLQLQSASEQNRERRIKRRPKQQPTDRAPGRTADLNNRVVCRYKGITTHYLTPHRWREMDGCEGREAEGGGVTDGCWREGWGWGWNLQTRSQWWFLMGLTFLLASCTSGWNKFYLIILSLSWNIVNSHRCGIWTCRSQPVTVTVLYKAKASHATTKCSLIHWTSF